MSLPITPTPVLRGLEAARFLRKLQAADRYRIRRRRTRRLRASKEFITKLIKRCRGG